MTESMAPAVSELAPIVKDSEAIAAQVSPVLFAALVFILVMINHAFFTEMASLLHTRVTRPLLEANKRMLARPPFYLGILVLVASHLVEI